jgi:adenylate kinase
MRNPAGARRLGPLTQRNGPAMRLILLGPPGSGKGTQAKLLGRDDNLEHISTGDLLRAAKDQGTPLGLRAKPYMDAGQLVPDDLVNELVAERFRRGDRPERFVMDGYPRTLSQAAAFDAVLREQFLDLNGVILLNVHDEEIVHRISGRRVCPNCNATYHIDNKPPKVPGVCDVCGHALEHRSDDKPETVRARLAVYHKDTVELIPHYRAQGLLREVAGEGNIDAVYANILKVLNTKASPSC